MPTGYTADVQRGKITDFPAFALLCARAFGATISMRDDGMDAPIPDEFQPSQHYAEWAREERARLDALLAMTPDEITAARDEAEAKRAASLAEAEERRAQELARYEAMLAAVKAWVPPTPEHVGLQAFMVEQLRESIRFDCGPVTYNSAPLPPPAEWHAIQIKNTAANLDRNLRSQREEEERVAGRNAWVRSLRQSLEKDDRDE